MTANLNPVLVCLDSQLLIILRGYTLILLIHMPYHDPHHPRHADMHDCAPWQGATTADSDFASAVQQIIALGFNTVKLPFSFTELLSTAAAPVAQQCTATSAEALQVILQRSSLLACSLVLIMLVLII